MTPILSAVLMASFLFVTFSIAGLGVAVIAYAKKVSDLKDLARNASDNLEKYLGQMAKFTVTEEHPLVKALRYCERAYEEPK